MLLVSNKKNDETYKKLRKPSKEVPSLKDGLEIAEILRDILESTPNAAGLSACQVGIFKKVFVVKTNEGILSFVNAKIKKMNGPFLFRNEGCLSFPGVYIDTIRYNSVDIEDLNNKEITLNNFAAVIFQHEWDHGEGKLFFDSQAPGLYDLCFCKSGKKFKFCCRNNIYK